jgi:hypothetical protein
MPATAGVYSRAEYNIAKQISSEDVRGWHACLRDLFNRAYPGEEVDNNLPLIEKFVTQLINKEVGKLVFERDPATFAGALALAQTKTATDGTFKTASRASIHAFANPSDNGVNYSGKGCGGGQEGRGKSGSSRPERKEGEAGKCWICNSSSHQKSDCPVWSKVLTLARKESGGGSVPDQRTGGSGGASHERANYRGRSSSSRTPHCPLSLPPPRRTRIILFLCLRAATIGRIRKTRRARFCPAGRGAGYYWGDICHLYKKLALPRVALD